MEDFKYFVRQEPYKPKERKNRICLLHCRVGLPSQRILVAFSFLYDGIKYEATCSFIDLYESKLYTMMAENIATELEKITPVKVDILDPQLVATQKWEI